MPKPRIEVRVGRKPDPLPRTCGVCSETLDAWRFTSTHSRLCQRCAGSYRGRALMPRPVVEAHMEGGMGWRDWLVMADAATVIRMLERP